MNTLVRRASWLIKTWLPSSQVPSAETSRSADRYRRATLTASASLLARGLALSATLIMVPLALRYLGPERYGMWMTITSFIALLGFADIGIGYSLLNAVAHAQGTGDRLEVARKVSSGALMLAFVAAILGLLFAWFYPLIQWDRVFAVTSPTARNEAGPSVAAWVGCFLLGLPLSVAAQVRMGHQEGYVVHVLTAGANLLSVLLLLVAIGSHQGLPILVVAVAGPQVGASATNWALVFWRKYSWLRPTLRLTDLRAVVALTRVSGLFLILQLAFAVAFTSDMIVVAQVVGPVAVAEYAVTSKLFLIPTVLVTTVCAALWPAYREAIALGDLAWARSTFSRSIRASLAVTLPSAIALVIGGLWLIHLWVGTTVRPPFWLVLGFGVWVVINGLGTAVAIFLNGAEEILPQAVTSVAMAAANIALSVWLCFRVGVSGAIWGTILSYTLLSLIPMALYVPHVLRKLGAR